MNKNIKDLVMKLDLPFERAALMAFIEVETGGEGFDSTTGKIMIQFEPSWFKKKAPYAPSGKWSLNKVERQAKEWIAFNDAFRINSNAAMESTSIGLGQIMGFHWKNLGYESVGAMWDYAKEGLSNQIMQIVQFIKANPKLLKAIQDHNWHLCAVYYNGAGYKTLAKKYGREPYNESLAKAYSKYIKTIKG